MELHGGQISASIEGVGKGSEFVVRLPVERASSLAELEPATGRTPPPPVERKHRILVVDDLRDSADSLAMLLRTLGNEVCATYNGEQALAEAEKLRPDFAFVDLGMPQMNGYEVCRRIRAQPWGATMVLIAQTGWGQDNDRRRTHEAGFDHHMVKPLEPQAIRALLGLEVPSLPLANARRGS